MLAKSIDMLLFFLVVATIALIAYKAIELFFGERFLKRPSPAALAASTEGKGKGEVALAERKVAVDEELERLEGGMAAMATLAAAAPFIGLMGTVLHIVAALSRISGASLDISLISGPIATALNSTLIGLASAVPAAIAYNMFSRRIQVLDNAARRVFERESAQGDTK
jgi:biopolymer transport protein ExbB/TolQ